jgi:hypothetical protein
MPLSTYMHGLEEGTLQRTNHRIANRSAFGRLGRKKLTQVKVPPRMTEVAILEVARRRGIEVSLGAYCLICASKG